jgi:hypothetical protein
MQERETAGRILRLIEKSLVKMWKVYSEFLLTCFAGNRLGVKRVSYAQMPNDRTSKLHWIPIVYHSALRFPNIITTHSQRWKSENWK